MLARTYYSTLRVPYVVTVLACCVRMIHMYGTVCIKRPHTHSQLYSKNSALYKLSMNNTYYSVNK